MIPKQVYSLPGHATYSEVEFLRGLGDHGAEGGARPQRHGIPQDRLSLLQGYLASMRNRADWGLIDHAHIRKVVLDMIEAETKHRAAFIPSNGHGIFGSRQYARRAGHRGGAE